MSDGLLDHEISEDEEERTSSSHLTRSVNSQNRNVAELQEMIRLRLPSLRGKSSEDAARETLELCMKREVHSFDLVYYADLGREYGEGALAKDAIPPEDRPVNRDRIASVVITRMFQVRAS